MSHPPRNNTVYSSFVFSNLPKLIGAGQGAYTINDLAAMVGLKPTKHFKRRVHQMVEQGLIVATPAFSPRGGLMLVYTSNTPLETGEHPF